MKPPPFAYLRPASLDDALEQLAQHGEDCKVLAGGQSLVPLLNMRLARPAALLDINRIGGLDEIALENGTLRVGALARQADLEQRSEVAAAVPLLARALPYVGHAQTRNRGTVCGSLAHADPSAELPLVAVALGAHVEARSKRGARRIAARELFASYFTTTLEPGEIIVSATFPAVQSGWGYAFEEFAERHGDFAIVATACALRVDAQGALAELRLAIGGVDERPVQAQTQRYAGRALDATAIGEIAADVSRALEPPSDRRGSAGYRHFLCRSQVARVIARALDEARA